MMLSVTLCAILANTQVVYDTNDPMVTESLSIRKPMVVEITGGVSESSAISFHKDMLEAQQTGQSVIPIVIDTYGGSVYAMFRMVDAIKQSKVPVATIIIGKAMSAGAVLASCGTEGLRYMSPRSTIMVHEISDRSGGKMKEIESNTEEGKRLNKMLFELMSVNIGKNPSYIKDIVLSKGNADWYLSPEQALEHNLINHIGIPNMVVTPKVVIDLINN